MGGGVLPFIFCTALRISSRLIVGEESVAFPCETFAGGFVDRALPVAVAAGDGFAVAIGTAGAESSALAASFPPMTGASALPGAFLSSASSW